MTAHHITLNGVDAVLDPDGALYLPGDGVLVVSDLHFEKGSAHAERGTLLPPYDTRATLARLARAIDAYGPRCVVCLGDSFHDGRAGERIGAEEIDTIVALMRGRSWIWIAGNHDPEPPAHIAGERALEIALGGILLRHEPTPGLNAGEIAGHLHPKAAIVSRGRRVTRRCFASDGQRLVMPAFGAFTGGLNVRHPAFKALFPAPFLAHMLGREKIRTMPSTRLA